MWFTFESPYVEFMTLPIPSNYTLTLSKLTHLITHLDTNTLKLIIHI